MKFEIGNAPEYKQVFTEQRLTKDQEELVQPIANNIISTLGTTPKSWAICGGAALTYLLTLTDNLPAKPYKQDVDILLDSECFQSYCISAVAKEQQLAPGESVLEHKPKWADYSAVPKIPFKYSSGSITFNELQIINNNPAAAILESKLKTIRNTNKSTSWKHVFANERLQTYWLNKEVRRLDCAHDEPFATSFLTINVVKYLASFDITLCQVALIFHEHKPICFVIADQAILSIASKRMSLTIEQADMFRLGSYSFVIKHHLQIVIGRIEKYCARYELELPHDIQDLIAGKSDIPPRPPSSDPSLQELSAEFPF